MTWTCPQCQNELGEYNAYCEYCKLEGQTTYNPNPYYIREIRIRHIEDFMNTPTNLSGADLLASIEANERMTPQEKLHATLFYHETILVKDMDHLTLNAHIEELSKIAFEARTRHGAATAEDDRRKKKSGPKGFERSVNTDETTTNAINTIKERQTKLTKKEQVLAGLQKLYSMAGNDSASKEASRITEAGTILARIKNEAAASKLIPLAEERERKPIVNPFEKKVE